MWFEVVVSVSICGVMLFNVNVLVVLLIVIVLCGILNINEVVLFWVRVIVLVWCMVSRFVVLFLFMLVSSMLMVL